MISVGVPPSARMTPSQLTPETPGQATLLLAAITSVLGCPADQQVVDEAVLRNFRRVEERLDLLVMAGPEIGLEVNPVRLTLKEALWTARHDQILVAADAQSGGYIMVRRHGFFFCQISTSQLPLERERVGRSELARRLGLNSVSEALELVVITAQKPAEGANGRSGGLINTHLESHAHAPGEEHSHPSPVRRFLGFLKPEMADVWTIVIFSAITGVLYLALPLAVNALVSNLAFGNQSGPFLQALIFIAMALFACLLLSGVMRGLQYYVAEVIQRRLFVRLTADMAYRLPRVDLASLDGVHAPEMVNRFLDVVTVQKSTSLILLNGINVVLGALIGLVVLGFYHPFLLAFTLLLVVLMALVVLVLGRGAIRSSIEESLSKYEVVGWLEEIARYPRLFKGPGGCQLASAKADRLARVYLGARRGHFRVLMRQICGLLLLEVVASSALLIVGGWLVINQQLTLGQLVASELIVGAIVASIAKLGKQFEAWYDAMAAMDKLGHLVDLQMERERGEVPTVKEPGLSVTAHEVSFVYGQGRNVFESVSFEIHCGERVALIGAQGSGTSTMMDLIFALRQPTAGHITVGGHDLRVWDLGKLRRDVMLLRSHDIVNGTVADNLRLGRVEIGLEEVDAALRAVGLLDDVLDLPQGVHTSLVTGGLPLSSTQRARLLLARALVMKPRLLMIDDVFDSLDPASTKALSSVIFDPAMPWTLIVATRDSHIVSHCARRISLNSETES